jgi:hypothetical protein
VRCWMCGSRRFGIIYFRLKNGNAFLLNERIQSLTQVGPHLKIPSSSHDHRSSEVFAIVTYIFKINTQTHTHSVGQLWTSDRPDAKTPTYKTHNTHNRQTSMHLAGFEPVIPASERPQTHASHRVATGLILLTTRHFLAFN